MTFTQAMARSAGDGGRMPTPSACALLAVDPVGLGGAVLRGRDAAEGDRWLERLRGLLPAGVPWRRIPHHVDADRLLGGLDLTATLRAGRPVLQPGLLAQLDGGIAIIPGAQMLGVAHAAAIAAVLDTHEQAIERVGIASRVASRMAVVALDEGASDDERVPERLHERLAFHIELDTAEAEDEDPTRADIAAARDRLPQLRCGDEIVEGLCATALVLGVASARATLFACRVCCAAAALDGSLAVAPRHAALAAALVLAPRATRLPQMDAEPESAAPQDPPPPNQPDDPVEGESESERDSGIEPQGEGEDMQADGPVDDLVLQAALAALPAGLLAALAAGAALSSRGRATAGRSGALHSGSSRGRPIGARRAEPQRGARLNLIETLRAAAPWQLLRRREAQHAAVPVEQPILVRREDFHVWRLRQRSETTTIFVVDASGSSALHRLAETKGAVELLLADCYVRRDSVAVIAFRGSGAELLLPATRSLVRAKRSLAGLPGGGGTPLAAGITAALSLADATRRRGAMPVVVLLTDGRANIALDGTPGRARAMQDALSAARRMRAEGCATLLLDTSPQPQTPARDLALEMGALYMPLPHADSSRLSQAVRSAAGLPAPIR